MVDPLSEVVTLLQPRTQFSKLIVGGGAWRVGRSVPTGPFYCVLLDGACRLTLPNTAPIVLSPGDFVLIPSGDERTLSSLTAPPMEAETAPPVALGDGTFRIGAEHEPIDVRMLVGHCGFGSPDAALLVSLLPRLVHVRGEQRLTTLVQLIRDESQGQRAAREVVLARLVELLLIEALRSATCNHAAPGLVRGLADPRLAVAIRSIHDRPTHAWTMADLAREAALSRTTFFERFQHAVGITPMAYLLAWRMALAKDLLRRTEVRIADIAARVGYGSASTFSVAFSRHVGRPPAQFAREARLSETDSAA